MTQYFLRVDAVNLANFVYDTHDISTIRGGSYLLLESIKKIKDVFSDRIQHISTAASQGVFSFDCPDTGDDCPEKLRREILSFLQNETEGHATFVIAIEKSGEDFRLILEKLEAQIHRLQWRYPTVAIPADGHTNQECYLDGWRPGVVNYKADPKVPDVKISASTQLRRERGKTLKHKLFYELLEDPKYEDNLCAKDLEELAQDKTQGILDSKIAFIYLDGNNFSRFRRKLCEDSVTRKEFDDAIQEDCRKSFLRKLLQKADHDPAFRTNDASGKEALRIEVLLWGGDEMMLVVPAWKGLEVVKLFYDTANTLTFKGYHLSHRTAVVFCHHNMPILQIRQIAEDLLSRTKSDIHQNLKDLLLEDTEYAQRDETSREELISLFCDPFGDAFHYLVLESFDGLGATLDKFLDTYYQRFPYNNLLIYADEIEKIFSAVKVLKSDLSYGKVLKLIQSLKEGGEENPKQHVARLLELVPRTRLAQVETAIESLTGGHLERWYLLADLWDYI